MLDWDRLGTLREEVGAEDFHEVIDLFLGEVEEKLGQIAAGRGGPPEEDMHFMKGAAMNLGFVDLANLCQTAEAQARRGDSDEIDLGAVFDCFEATKQELEKASEQRFCA